MAVYDCCMIFNEIDLLKIRMELLNSVVDYFVVVELNKTFRGEDKKYYFKERENEFAIFEDKIIYVNSDSIPMYEGDGDWSIERHQRNCMIKALLKCNREDIIMISDVDEIPNPNIIMNLDKYNVSIRWYKKMLSKKCLLKSAASLSIKNSMKLFFEKLNAEEILDKLPILLRLRNFYYYMDCQGGNDLPGTVICKYKNLALPQVLRETRHNMPCIIDSGWHFSYLGGVEKVKLKLRSIIDDRPDILEKMKEYSSQDDYIISCLEEGKDLFNRIDMTNSFRFISKEEIRLPNVDKYIKEYPDFFSNRIR